MSKRVNGEGTIYYSEKLNKWIGQYTAGFKLDGKINRKSVYGNTRKEVKEKITLALSKLQTNTYCDKSMLSIGQLAQTIIDNKFNANIISESTYYRHISTLKTINDSGLGNIAIQKVTSEQIQEFLNSNKHLSNSYITKLYQLLNATFVEAMKKEIIYKNPILNVIKPKSKNKTKVIDSLSIEEQKLFQDNIDDSYKNILMIALHSGLRIGEILSLTPENIDFENKSININNTLSRNSQGKTIVGKSTKTYNSIRTIPITIVLEPFLKESLGMYKPNENNLLFCQNNGKLIEPSTINSHFKRICKNIGINKEVNTHMLRHTYATRCIEAGVPAEVLQKLLGHTDISITINTYTTIFDKYKEKSLDKYINYIQNI